MPISFQQVYDNVGHRARSNYHGRSVSKILPVDFEYGCLRAPQRFLGLQTTVQSYSCGYHTSALGSYMRYLDVPSVILMPWPNMPETGANKSFDTVKPIDQRPPQTPSRKRQRISVHGDSGPSRMTDDYSSDSDSDMDPAEGNILKITETIGGTMTRLFRLSNAVRKSAKANRARKIQMYTDDQEANKAIEELRLYTKCYIKFRFPEAPETLRTALVEANALRLRRLYYQHSHRRRIDLSIQIPGPSPVAVVLPKMDESMPTVRFAPNPMSKPATITKMPAPSPAPATNATTARQTAVAALYAKSTTEVPRAKSVFVNNKLSFPPMPLTQQCPYCGVVIEFKNGPKSLLWQ